MKRALTLLMGGTIITTSVFATNGTQLIGTTAKARGMGGVGVATYMGAGASNNNPALYAKETGMTLSGGLTFFSPTVTYQDGGGKDTSTYGTSILPDIGYAHKINDDMAIGVGMTATAGFGTHYNSDGSTAAAGSANELKVLQFNVPFSYNFSSLGATGLALGIAPVLQSSELSTAGGSENSTDFGINLGLTYDIETITLGLLYKTEIKSDYGNALGTNLANPAVFGLGINFQVSDTSSFAIDYKNLGYGRAEGYKDFGWANQNVFAAGYEYQGETFALRAGLNYGSNLIEGASVDNTVATYIGFPAITAAHATLGGGFDLKKAGKIDVAFVYGASFSDTFTYTTTAGQSTLTKATNNQLSATVDYTYAF